MRMWYAGGEWHGMSSRKGKAYTGDFRSVWLWCMGYGSDQAAELRCAMKKKMDGEA